MAFTPKQKRFKKALTRLLHYAAAKDYPCDFAEVRGGYIRVGREEYYTHENNSRRLGMEIHLNVESPRAYHDLGKFWEKIDGDAVWGGRFGDVNSFLFKELDA